MNQKPSHIIPAFGLTGLLSISAAVSAGDEYLFELLEQPKYLQAWDKLIASQQGVDEWLANYSKTKNGPTSPGTVVDLEGKRYQVNFVCKTHDCGDNHFVVMFAEDDNQAWGLLQRAGKEDVYFGEPDSEKIKIMEAEGGR